MAYSSSFCSFHSEKELISFCLLAANSAEALFDLKKLKVINQFDMRRFFNDYL